MNWSGWTKGGGYVEAVQKRIGSSRAAKASFILGRVTRSEKGHRKNSGLNCICENYVMWSLEGGEGEKWSQPTEMNPAVAKRGGPPSLPLKLRSKKGRGREGGGLWRVARTPRGREREGGALGPLRILSKRSMHRCTLGSSEQNSVAKNENRSKVPSRVENVADESVNVSE